MIICRGDSALTRGGLSKTLDGLNAQAELLAEQRTRAMIVAFIVIGLISYVLLTPLYYLWFRLLGWM